MTQVPSSGENRHPSLRSVSVYYSPSNESFKNCDLWKQCLSKEDSPLGLSISQHSLVTISTFDSDPLWWKPTCIN